MSSLAMIGRSFRQERSYNTGKREALLHACAFWRMQGVDIPTREQVQIVALERYFEKHNDFNGNGITYGDAMNIRSDIRTEKLTDDDLSEYVEKERKRFQDQRNQCLASENPVQWIIDNVKDPIPVWGDTEKTAKDMVALKFQTLGRDTAETIVETLKEMG